MTDYETDVKGKDGGLLGGVLAKKVPVIGGVKVKNSYGRVGLNFRLINATTSEIVYTKQIESTIKESGLDFGAGALFSDAALGGFMSSYSRTPIGQAVIAGVNEGVYDLAQQIGTQPATGSVVKAEGNQVWLNLGSGAVKMGDRLEVKRKGEELIDPDTGISLGSSDTTLGEIEVTQVQEQFSIARVVALSSNATRGDVVVSRVAPTSIEYAASWTKPQKKR